MNNVRNIILAAILTIAMTMPFLTRAAGHDEGGVNVKEVIFHHLEDGYGWEVPFSHVYRIALPVIVRTQDGKWVSFSSSRLSKLVEVPDTIMGGTMKVAVPQIVTVENGDTDYHFVLAHESKHKNKIVQIFPLDNGVTQSMVENIAA